MEEVGPYAREHGIPYNRPEELVNHPHIRQLLEGRVAQINQRLASYETIKKFIIAPTDFSQEDGQLTPTLKVKRQAVIQKYQTQLEQLYQES
jgi:long-chain acyl-CoA synthetase